jgi:hypothetical protein
VPLRAATPPTGRAAEVYMADQTPARPFYEVALVQAIGHGTEANPEDVVKSLRARSEQLGCDAVVRVRVEQGYSMAHGFGVCVRYAGAAGAPLAAPPAASSASPPAPAPTTPPPSPSDVDL